MKSSAMGNWKYLLLTGDKGENHMILALALTHTKFRERATERETASRPGTLSYL